MENSYLILYQSSKEMLEEELLKNKINKFIILNSRLATIYTNNDFDESILNQIYVISWWQRSNPMSSLINITNNIDNGHTVETASNIDFVEKNPYIEATGKNVIIAIIDSGIDYLHPDFINKDNTSKILSIWDQNSIKGNPPKGLLFGTEISKEEINKAIREKDPSLTEDEVGTGTIAAGICSGKGNLNHDYRGVALDSELVVVKLRQYKGPYDESKISYQTSDFLAAIKYLEKFDLDDDKFLIINHTVGKSPSPALEASLFESFSFLSRPNVIMVGGSGNEGNTDIHHHGIVRSINETEDIIIQVGEQKDLEIILYLNGPDKIGGRLISPSGEISDAIVYSPDYNPYVGYFNLENTAYEIQYVYPWIETGYEKFFIYSTYRGQTYNTGTGTGVSSSIVCGVLAVLIDYITGQKSYTKDTIYTSVLKTYLMLGATKLDIYEYPNTAQGYGLLNLQNTFIQVGKII